MTARGRRAALLLGVLLALVAAALPASVGGLARAAVPPGFVDTVVLSGRVQPTSVAFARDGSVLIAEKAGRIWRYADLGDREPVLVADLTAQVHDFWDRGLLGLAISGDYPADNALYVLYTYDAPLGGTAPTWGDACPSPPGPTTDGCVVSSRLSRLNLSRGVSTGEQVLVSDWCQQFPSHSAGTLAFGPDGYLYASGGDGAGFGTIDYGQLGAKNPGGTANPCGDPPGGAGTALAPPDAQGGALRSQSVRRAAGPVSLDGTVIRIDPATGLGAPGNPFAGSPDRNRARVIAYGMRNPFRFTVRPGTDELWVGDVGAGTWEEVNRIGSAGDGVAENFGWPCFEGAAQQAGFSAAGLSTCTDLYAAPEAVTPPYAAYRHGTAVVEGDGCRTTGGSALTAVAFYPGGSYPESYRGALFFADSARQCLWAMRAGADGLPDPADVVPFSPAASPVQLVVGPGGDIYYVDVRGGSLHRISYSDVNQPPVSRFTATPVSGVAPLEVQFDGSASSDPEGGTLRYAWDFGDGTFAYDARTSHRYDKPGTWTARLTVIDPRNVLGASERVIKVGAAPPAVTLGVRVLDPATGQERSAYRVGDRIAYTGSATDGSGNPLPASAFSWELVLHHGKHTHDGGTATGVTTGSFSAPDHDYPSSLGVRVRVVDPASGLGAVRSLRVYPATTPVTFRTTPTGLGVPLGADLASAPASYTRRFVVGHQLTVSAPSRWTSVSRTYTWRSWSDGGARSHGLPVPPAPLTLTATYR